MDWRDFLDVNFFSIQNISRVPFNEDGLVAVGGDLSPFTILCAYSCGIFPWFNDDDLIICWWYINPRMVLFPSSLKVSRSLSKKLRNTKYLITFNFDFKSVISNCALSIRKNQAGTWITSDMISSYLRLHDIGFAISFEYWELDVNNVKVLLGGLYGLKIGNIFFGESMFTKKSDASKIAFVHAVKFLEGLGVVLIDCQMSTNYLSSFGAYEISKGEFDNILSNNIFFNKEDSNYFLQRGTIINNY